MQIGALKKFSLIDYPGKTAAVVFTQGCNFRCPYCYNRELVLPDYYENPIPEAWVLEFLRTRAGRLDGVVITGGEPTVQPDLADFIARLKQLGLAVKLDINGSRPELLNILLGAKLVDYIAMDVKAPVARYPEVIGAPIDAAAITASIHLIMNSGIDYEFRTTLVREWLSPVDLDEIGKAINGSRRYVLQTFLPTETLVNPAFKRHTAYSEAETSALQQRMRLYAQEVLIR